MPVFTARDQDFYYETLGAPPASADTVILWAHGWGQSGESLKPLAASLGGSQTHILIDFPGFGRSPAPSEIRGTGDYADAVADWLKTQDFKMLIWAGHSFGCRVGIQIAARHPELIGSLFLMAAAGLKRKRPWHKQLYFKSRILLFKALKKLIPFGLKEDWLRTKFGSADYKSAGPMRTLFVKVVNEDLSETARAVACPVLLVYGENDTETPPEIGRRLEKLMPDAKLVQLPGLDHYTILGPGRHQAAHLLKQFLKER